jgi:hypothetical protein
MLFLLFEKVIHLKKGTSLSVQIFIQNFFFEKKRKKRKERLVA